eukprot:gi/632960181/ref/XP_007896048.1/ PREDICTED: migration and invasion-inhibitory protein isoform X2 [Callorhinchus milii]
MRYSQALLELRDQNQRQLQRLRSGRRELGAAGLERQSDAASGKSQRLTDQTSDGGRIPEEFVIRVSPGRRAVARATLCSPGRDRATHERLRPSNGGPAWLALGRENIQPGGHRGAVQTNPALRQLSTVNSPRLGSLTRAKTPSRPKLATGFHQQPLSGSRGRDVFKSSTPFRQFPVSRQAGQPEAPNAQQMAARPRHWATSAPAQSPFGSPRDCSRLSHSFGQGGWLRPGTGPGPRTASYRNRLLTEGNEHATELFREDEKPKPILAAASDHAARAGVGQVTFLLPDEEQVPRAGDRSLQPLLGYDWIAGLMDIDCSLSERAEQYFTDLQDFRRVNKEECIREEYLEAGQRDPGTSEWKLADEELDPSRTPHQCSHCFRVNSRLFVTPLDPEAACPVCKTPKAKRPHTRQEPAYIRVSIPRSTLLAPYQYRAHRRKSFDASDSLSLPSHCLLGWESARPAITPAASSLDLHSSLSLGAAPPCLSLSTANLGGATSRVTGGMRSDELMDMSRSANYQLQRLMNNQPQATFLPGN